MEVCFFGAAAAVWFGLMARRADRAWLGWALGGGIFGLAASTVVLGVLHAQFLPVSQAAYVHFRIRSFLEAFLVVLVFGWLLTLSVHRRGDNCPTEGGEGPR